MLTVTNPVELDQQEVSSFVGALKSLSLGSIAGYLTRGWSDPALTGACTDSCGRGAAFCSTLSR